MMNPQDRCTWFQTDTRIAVLRFVVRLEGSRGSLKLPCKVYKLCSIRKRTLGSISCITTTFRPLRPIPTKLCAFGATPGHRIVHYKLQLLIGVLLTQSTCPLFGTKRRKEQWSGRDYMNTTSWLIVAQPKSTSDSVLYTKNNQQLRSSQATSHCLVTADCNVTE